MQSFIINPPHNVGSMAVPIITHIPSSGKLCSPGGDFLLHFPFGCGIISETY